MFKDVHSNFFFFKKALIHSKFADFHGVITPTMDNFKSQVGHH